MDFALSEEQRAIQETFARFTDREVAPKAAALDEAHAFPREEFRALGRLGFFGMRYPEAAGGSGMDMLTLCIAVTEIARGSASLAGCATMQSLMGTHFLYALAGADIKERLFKPALAGEKVGGICMTEPDAGSDLQRMRTTAVRQGDHYVVNGSKIFITNGIVGDLCLLVAKTDPTKGARGVSLLLVDTNSPGYQKSKSLKKIGNKAQDTAVLYFDDMKVPVDNRLGGENEGWRLLMSGLVQERLIVAVRAVSTCEAALEQTIAYTKERKAFGQRVFDFQNTRFTLAELVTEVQIARHFMDRCIRLHAEGACDMRTAAMVKLSTTELQQKVLDACLQLHGGNGYMWEYWIARAWADARVHRIYAGTNEIMKELIGRTL